jgi:hypothetical protein
MKSVYIIVLIFFAAAAYSQETKNGEQTKKVPEKKSLAAYYITAPINIDGVLDEEAYSKAEPAKDFVQLMPNNGKPALRPSEVRILYDQNAIYVGAMLYDDPDSIFNFLSERDQIGISDYFGIYFDPYNQGQLAYGFFITPAGVQTDLKAIKTSFDYEDGSWDAVWQSKTRVTDDGWIVELKIPYSALRFPENGGGTWGINMFRNFRRYASNNSWNFLDREVSGFIHQFGQLTGVQNIKPPFRLSLSPYAAAYTEFKTGKSSPDFTYKGGMDLKYGISEAFTLDMMLVPDFGQIQSDDKQLNLSPYELYYSEKRQFFTEGTELFERGGIFYSRRIGASPRFANRAGESLAANEEIDYNPTETQLLNATKVSGRTSKGWGLGMLNAISLPSHAELKDTVTGAKRKVLIQPLTNYNVAVIDKSLKNNSYISLINSNMIMANDPFRANVTATDFQIRNKKKTYAISGKGGFSTRTNGEHETGYFGNLEIEKNSGKLRFGIEQSIISDKFNPNDLGYLQRNNELNTEAFINYNIIEPFWIIRELHANIWMEHERSYKPNAIAGNATGLNFYTQFKNNYHIEFNFNAHGDFHDYYEPRVRGRYYTEPWYYQYNVWAGSDYRKALHGSAAYSWAKQPDTDQRHREGDFFLNLRLGRHLVFEYNASFENEINDRGFVNMTENSDTVYFARRDVNTFQNVFGVSYAVNNKASLSMRMRHYWSGAANHEYYQLQENGSLVSDPAYVSNHDANYNAFNIDLVFRWIFAPGSELSLAWKNAILSNEDKVVSDYFKNLNHTWNSDQINSFSIRALYYIDYNSLRKKKS